MSGGVGLASLPWIQTLMGMDTVSRHSNRVLIDAVADELSAHGVSFQVLPDAEGTKANLVATLPDRHGRTQGGVVLSGHTDVVPVDGQRWQSGPFEPDIRDGRLYGRGACDMKGFLGVLLTKLPEMARAELAFPLHLAFTYDEEVGMGGGAQLVKDIMGLGLNPELCIVGEPTEMKVVTGHKSLNLFRLDFQGVAVHSSLAPRGVNAVEYAAAMVTKLGGLAARFAAEGPYDDDYEVPHSTLSVNVIGGGEAINTVAGHCQVELDYRTVAAHSPQQVQAQIEGFGEQLTASMRAHHATAGMTTTALAMVPGLDTAHTSAAVQFAIASGGHRSRDRVTFGTEAGLYQAAGIETIVCGPGSIHQAHAPDEYIALDEIGYCEDFITTLLAQPHWACSNPPTVVTGT